MPAMKFCSACGGPVTRRIPPGDNRERFVCDHCGAIHYVNPKIVAGCLVEHDGRVLLCRRGIEPRKGLWTLPAGFLELGETTLAGALRETWEEACAKVDAATLYTVFNLPHISQVYLFYRGRLIGDAFAAGEETTEVALFDESDIPWDELAFPVVTNTLKHFLADRTVGAFPVRVEDIVIDRR